ncbi:MAG: thrombospondin type 3 repeat-containing protein [Acidobacteriota bacterium]
MHQPLPLLPGVHTFTVTSISKSGFVWETARDVATVSTRTVLSSAADLDGDGVANLVDNCRQLANPNQADLDGDGVGDACDVCPGLDDPAQKDFDADGVGDRCDCAPFNAASIDVAEVAGVSFASDKTTLSWDGVVGADRYDLQSGLVSQLPAGDYGACVANDLGQRRYLSSDPVAVGSARFFVVIADDATCGQGTLGRRSNGVERINANPSRCSLIRVTSLRLTMARTCGRQDPLQGGHHEGRECNDAAGPQRAAVDQFGRGDPRDVGEGLRIVPVVDEADQLIDVVTDRDICIALGTHLCRPHQLVAGEMIRGNCYVAHPWEDWKSSAPDG